MKRIGFVVAACVVWLGCKGSAATTEPAAPSASTATTTNTTTTATTTTTTATAPSAAASTPPADTVGTLRPRPPAGPCTCARIQVGGIYPHQNGHAMQRHDQDVKVLSVDSSACTATLKDVASGATRTERCDSSFFDEPYINPAG